MFMGRLLLIVFFIVCLIRKYSLSLPSGCKEMNTLLDCSHSSLRSIPKNLRNRYTRLNLSANHISVVPFSVFENMTKLRVLDLSKNRIRRIEKGASTGLKNLEALNVSDNRLSYDKMNGETMAELVNLKTLDISGKEIEAHWYPNRTLEALSNLEVLTISLVNGAAFGRELGKLNRLREIDFTHGYLSNSLFLSLKNISIKSVRFRNCSWTTIHNNPFDNLPLLEEVEIREHRGTSLKKILPLVSHVRSPLKRLSLEGINSPHHRFNVTQDYLKLLSHLPIEYLSFKSDYISDFAWTLHKYLPKLRYLSLSRNPFLFYYLAVQLRRFRDMHVDLIRLRHLAVLDISGLTDKETPESNHLMKRKRSITERARARMNLVKFALPRNLEELYCQGLFLQHSFVTDVLLMTNKLKIIDMSWNRFMIFPVTREIIGANNVETLNLAFNDLRDIPPGILQNMTSLKTLILSGNLLADKLATDIHGVLFQNMTNVTLIDLSGNGIYGLHVNIFSHLKNVRKVILRNNRLVSLPALKHRTLAYLDLSRNFLTDGFVHFDNLTALGLADMTSNRMQYLSNAFLKSVYRGNITVTLADNPFNCTRCELLVFLRWLTDSGDVRKAYKIQDNRTLYCSQKSVLRLSDFRFNTLQNKCTPTLWIWLSISTISAIAILTVCLGVAYRRRWTIRFWLIHAARRKYDRLPSIQYKYDAFLCHSSEDVAWVERIHKSLECGEECGLKLCIYYRDFPLGLPIVECIDDAIVNSRYIVLLITKSFIKSQWCIYEFFMAKTKVFCEENRSRLIILILENLSADVLSAAPRTLQNVMRDNVYLEWTDDTLGQEQFWQRLRDSLVIDPPLYIP